MTTHLVNAETEHTQRNDYAPDKTEKCVLVRATMHPTGAENVRS